ncbi:MAG: 2-oxo acid dehydrogenase subunit E2 [Gammaproteobacteria bacterium CG_4_10_14_0_8_um_filter_38_16]|nr:MAG: 2-oxo acid dehydrogenase subunit E2 [Gammaproteobacteria bacterium CG_4_10_14_0_8_um_filter_38_16]PJA03543.1 MAG: 2-oxo acid dehydrogenase subunit E2 [Gammaproteobacteria bacterium CG_4_10_14_0_2_um_filter_38_22]PJB11165.1 MAG: 2-oxo acid dehydrogenase subunit E2 [Gammaproteobacteria bacterium CG_4_9_14_3_um_filter_38_9]
MKIFKLPDLGEGLPDAIIREWHVKTGDLVKKDQPIAAMETAKALVDVVAPFDATIEKLFGHINDTIETGKPLIGFEGEADASEIKKDTGTVVGKIEQSEKIIATATFSTTGTTSNTTIKATPVVRALARKLNVDLSQIKYSGNRITTQDVENAAIHEKPNLSTKTIEPGWETLSNIKRAMVMSMQQSHHDIVPVTLIDEVDIHAWVGKQDITVRIIRAMLSACKTEPALNAHFNSKNMSVKKFTEINLGLAVDMPHGLFVPVIKDTVNLSDEQIREHIDRFKQQAQSKSIPQNDLKGATIVLSNFGAIAGKYANPIILPPTVGIVGVGRITKSVALNDKNQAELHKIIPLSLSVDHRAITGGEAARFLKAIMDALSAAT